MATIRKKTNDRLIDRWIDICLTRNLIMRIFFKKDLKYEFYLIFLCTIPIYLWEKETKGMRVGSKTRQIDHMYNTDIVYKAGLF